MNLCSLFLFLFHLGSCLFSGEVEAEVVIVTFIHLCCNIFSQ